MHKWLVFTKDFNFSKIRKLKLHISKSDPWLR